MTHFVYSHHHADHGSAASLFDGDVIRIGYKETRRLLLRDEDPGRPLPDVTFADRYTLEVGGFPKPYSGHADTISITVRVCRSSWSAMKPRIECVVTQ